MFTKTSDTILVKIVWQKKYVTDLSLALLYSKDINFASKGASPIDRYWAIIKRNLK